MMFFKTHKNGNGERVFELRRRWAWLPTALSFGLALLLGWYAWQYADEIHAEQAHARRQRARADILLEVVDANNASLVIVNELGKILLWNAGAEDMFGWTEQQVLGSDIRFLMADDHAAYVMGLFGWARRRPLRSQRNHEQGDQSRNNY